MRTTIRMRMECDHTVDMLVCQTRAWETALKWIAEYNSHVPCEPQKKATDIQFKPTNFVEDNTVKMTSRKMYRSILMCCYGNCTSFWPYHIFTAIGFDIRVM